MLIYVEVGKLSLGHTKQRPRTTKEEEPWAMSQAFRRWLDPAIGAHARVFVEGLHGRMEEIMQFVGGLLL